MTIEEVLKRSGLDPARIHGVVMGNVIQAGNKMNPPRRAAIHGSVPVDVPAMTVNRACGPGAQEIWLGLADRGFVEEAGL